MIADYTVQKVLDNADCKDVIADYLDLKKKGANFVCCCPFHSEKTGSFTVNPARNRWHCYGCGKGGRCGGVPARTPKPDLPRSD